MVYLSGELLFPMPLLGVTLLGLCWLHTSQCTRLLCLCTSPCPVIPPGFLKFFFFRKESIFPYPNLSPPLSRTEADSTLTVADSLSVR